MQGFNLGALLGNQRGPNPEIDDYSNQLLRQGRRDVSRAMQGVGTQFGGSDIVSSPRMRSQALMGSDLWTNTLSNILGVRSQSEENRRGYEFQNFLADKGFNQQLDMQKIQAQLLPLQFIQMLFGLPGFSQHTGGSSGSGFGFDVAPLPPPQRG